MGCFEVLLTLWKAIFGMPPSLPEGPNGRQQQQEVRIHGRVVLRKKGFLDLNDLASRISDSLSDLVGHKLTFQLVSAHAAASSSSSSSVSSGGYHGIGGVSNKVPLQHWDAKEHGGNLLLADQGSQYGISFLVDKGFGKPGALLITNDHPSEFFLDSVTLEIDDGHTKIHFPWNSWIYNSSNYSGPRIFFSNEVFLPNQTPPGLRALRNEELKQLRGDGTGTRKEVDRVYDYALYNDLGNPDKGKEYARPVLGGSQEYPYPRRCYTGRKRANSDPSSEEPTSLFELGYVPRDEIFDRTKTSDFLATSIKAVAHLLLPAVTTVFEEKDQFQSLEEVRHLYVKGIDLSSASSNLPKGDDQKVHIELLSELFSKKDTGDTSLLKFPLPEVIRANEDAWSTDEEFARQTVGGMHPITIERLQVFPPVSKLDPKVYGSPVSRITADHILPYLEGMTVQEALEQKRIYILNYHDTFLPYIERINAMEGHKAYASRSIFFLTKQGTLKPVAIELRLPNEGETGGRVFVPPTGESEKENWIWRLAKTHAILNDTPVHQLVSHFLRTHAAIEPFIIASYRQLSAIHPLFVLLHPHFKNTMNINAIARKILLNANTGNALEGGFIERTFTAGRYALEISSASYKEWRFDEQGLPADLIKRGMAEKDAKAKHGLRLMVEDYPYAVDGLEVWEAIESWVRDYVMIYYKSDQGVKEDLELQGWWAEVREKGHGDRKNDGGWVPMNTVENVVGVMTTLIWLASAHHAAINFGQYAYAGYMPYRPTMGRRLIPLPGTAEHAAFLANPEAFLLSSVPSPTQAALGLAIIELLSTHASNEEYLGQRATPHWTHSPEVLLAFKSFQDKLARVEEGINLRNDTPSLKNRYGDVQVPYTLLFPRSKEGITNRGIPNSTSI